MLFFARSLILARLLSVSPTPSRPEIQQHPPVLKPDLNRPLRHINVLGNLLSHGGRRGGVLVEFLLQRDQLVLRGALALLVLLLLGQGALARRAARRRGGAGGRIRGGRRWR